jgi:hypothetical protein
MRLTTAQITFIAIFLVTVYLYPGKQKKWMFALALALSLLHTYDQYIDFVHEPDWHYNDHFFKRIGKKFERLCRDCFNNAKLRVSPRDLLNRQTGVSRMVRPKSRAMTVDELSVFARTLQTYFKHRQYDIRLGE